MRRFLLIVPLVALLAAACTGSPKARASDWARRFPEEIGMWEVDDDWLELTAENQSNYGHITLTYEGKDDYLAYISVDTFATVTAADVELGARLREWELRGVRFSRERFQGEPIDVAVTPGGYLGFYQAKDAILTLAVIPPADDDGLVLPLPDAAELELLLETIVAVAKNR